MDPLYSTRKMPAVAVPGDRKYGKEENDLLLRLLAWLDTGRKEAIRQQYVTMLGLAKLTPAEQDKKLYGNKAYEAELSAAEQQTDRDKRLLREIFERMPRARDLYARMTLRRDRLKRMRDAAKRRLEDLAKSYRASKRLYDEKFEKAEAEGYAKGAARVEEDRKRYEAMSAELELKIREESETILKVQKAAEESEQAREAAEQSLAQSREAIESAMNALKLALSRVQPRPADKPGDATRP